MMNKTKAEIEQMASFICREKGQYMFNKKEIGIITGLCKDKVAELCDNIPAGSVCVAKGQEITIRR